MTTTNHSTSHMSLSKRMLIGAAIGLGLITFFLISAGEANLEWGKFWRLKPLFMVPFAGAMGGLCNHMIFQYRVQFGVNKILATILSLLVFIIGLWMGTVLGLNGTYWD
jgi:hypothetical protein